jgi:hypothetical protein
VGVVAGSILIGGGQLMSALIQNRPAQQTPLAAIAQGRGLEERAWARVLDVDSLELEHVEDLRYSKR